MRMEQKLTFKLFERDKQISSKRLFRIIEYVIFIEPTYQFVHPKRGSFTHPKSRRATSPPPEENPRRPKSVTQQSRRVTASKFRFAAKVSGQSYAERRVPQTWHRPRTGMFTKRDGNSEPT